MSVDENSIGNGDWLRQRLRRHVGEIMRLAWPATLSRLGVMVLALVDTLMVAHFGTDQLAYLQLGAGSAIMLILVAAIGMVMGTLVFTADAYGRGDLAECGQVFRRSTLFAVLIGIVATVAALPGETMLLLAGQTPELASEGGRVLHVLAFGLAGHVVYINGVLFLEGLERPKVAMYVAAAGNLLNVGINWTLIFGHLGFPALGAEGSAWATSILRLVMGGAIVAYILWAPSLAHYQIRRLKLTPWADWRSQRHMGYANAVSLGAEVVAFAALSLFAGLLGKQPLAAWGIVMQAMSLAFMLAIGFGSAAGVRVGIANSRRDARDAELAGWTALVLAGMGMALLGLLLALSADPVARFATDDPSLVVAVTPLLAFAAYAILVDGLQGVLANALRGLGETWVPTAIQSFTYIVVMLPLSYALAIPAGRGVRGMLEAVIVASIVSAVLQSIRFRVAARRVGGGVARAEAAPATI